MYVEASEPPLEERWLKLSMHSFLKICAMPCNHAYLAMNKFICSTKQLYKARPNGRGGMIQPPTAPVGLQMKAAMKEPDIDTSKICPLDMPDLPPGTHAHDPESDNLIEGVTKNEISSSHAKAKFQEYQDEQGNHDEVYTDGAKINEKVGAAAVIKRLFQDGKIDRYKHLKRAEVAMTRLCIGHCKGTKGHSVSRGPPAVCQYCGSTLSREHILLECGAVQELRGEFYEADSLTSFFECVRPLAIIEYLKEAGFFHLI